MSSDSEDFPAGDMTAGDYQDDGAVPRVVGEELADFWVISDRVWCEANVAGANAKLATHTSLCSWGSATSSGAEVAAAIAVRGCKITQVLPAEQLRRGAFAAAVRAAGTTIIDEGARPIVPAWVNAHTHLALAPLRGITSQAARAGNVVSDVFFKIESHMTAEDVRAFSRMGAYEALLAGNGCVWDHFYFGNAIAEALLDVGLCGVVAPTLQDVSGPGASQWETQLSATHTIASSSHCAAGGVFAAYGPHAGETVSLELMRRVGDLARHAGLPIHLHLAQAASEMQRLFSRVRPGEDCPAGSDARKNDPLSPVIEALSDNRVLMAHGLFVGRASMPRLSAAGWVLAYCPYSQLQFGFLSPVSSWHAAGGKIALGTDCVASNDALDVQRELPLLAGEMGLRASFSQERLDYERAEELSEELVLAVEARRAQLSGQAQYVDGAQLLLAGLGASFGFGDNQVQAASTPDLRGGIAPGRLANFHILDPLHPALFPGDDLARSLAYGSTHGAIVWGVIAGRQLGRLTGFQSSILGDAAYRDARAEADARRQALLRRAGLS